MTILNNIFLNNISIASIGAFQDIECEGKSTFTLQIVGTYVGTLIVEGLTEGGVVRPIQMYRDSFGWQPTTLPSALTNTILQGACAKYQTVRVRAVAWTSGTAIVSLMSEVGLDPVFMQPRAADAHLRLQTAATTAGTLTLPAAPDLFHYISRIEIKAHVAAATTAAAANTITDITTTNLGALAWDLAYESLAVGKAETIIVAPSTFLRSTTAGVATTIVMPALTGIAMDAKVSYYTAV